MAMKDGWMGATGCVVCDSALSGTRAKGESAPGLTKKMHTVDEEEDQMALNIQVTSCRSTPATGYNRRGELEEVV